MHRVLAAHGRAIRAEAGQSARLSLNVLTSNLLLYVVLMCPVAVIIGASVGRGVPPVGAPAITR
jgi:hypothetical protein